MRTLHNHMADVTIPSLPLGTPSGNVYIPYSDGNTTYRTSPSAIVANSAESGTYSPQLFMWQYTNALGYYNLREVFPYSTNVVETTGTYTKMGNMLYVSWQWINRTGGGSSVPQNPAAGAGAGVQSGWAMKLPSNINNNKISSLAFIPGGYATMNGLGAGNTILPHRWQSNFAGYLTLYGELAPSAWTYSILNFSAAGWLPLE